MPADRFDKQRIKQAKKTAVSAGIASSASEVQFTQVPRRLTPVITFLNPVYDTRMEKTTPSS